MARRHYHGAVRIQLLLSLALLVPFARAQKVTLPLWPGGNPEPYTGAPEADITKPSDRLVADKPLMHLTNIGKPTLAFYPAPAAKNTGATVVVFPGGAYRILAYDLEGTDVCAWLNSIGVNCALVKYRVPFEKKFPDNTADLEDAQQAVRITRSHALEWKLDAHRVGVLGFSAGGHLVIVLGNHPDFVRAGAPASETAIGARPDFVVAIYPAYLAEAPALTQLAKGIDPSANTPPTFLLQAEDDPVHVENVLIYEQALKQLKVPSELHVYAEGGHGYGLRPTALPVTHWPSLVETWLNTIKVIPSKMK
ncbi:MAG: alpha/beta hydrolase [Acidobacteria bacterium]|nr:alpha/beta hydrolase [Acidobacteriota bacterium]